ncbi:SRPBCC family protein [Nocardia sp. NPDC048505]|uniref:SRPBCC family protein n=1 Tax=unclassified Nocardia TaxID=2637762 RepID=UPI0033F7AC1C
MGHVEHTAVGNAPRDFTFEYVNDYRNVPRWMFGIKEFKPAGEQSSGLGTVFDTAINLGPMTMHVRVDVVEWEEHTVFTLRAAEGQMRWLFETLDSDTTRITVVCDYSIGGGIAGRPLDLAIQAFIGPAIRHAEKNLRQLVESGYRESSKA